MDGRVVLAGSRRMVLALASVVLVLGLAAPASALQFVVNKTADSADGVCDADCSLREAIIATNVSATDDLITVPAGSYVLGRPGPGEDLGATGDLDIVHGKGQLTIVGAGARTTTIAGDGSDRVLNLFGVAVISGVTITGGAGVAQGAGIKVENGGYITLRDAGVVANTTSAPGNVSRQGGGLYIGTTQSRLERVLVARNSAIAVPGDAAPPRGQGSTWPATSVCTTSRSPRTWPTAVLPRCRSEPTTSKGRACMSTTTPAFRT